MPQTDQIISDRHARRLRAKAAAEAVEELEPGALVNSDAAGKPIGLTVQGLAMVQELAGQGKPIRYIAAKLRVSNHQFETLLGKASSDNPTDLRLAWERGHAEHEAAYRRHLFRLAQKQAIPAIFYGKSIFGMKDQPPPPETTINNRIQLTLPRSSTKEEMYARLGITAPLDYRSAKAREEQPHLEPLVVHDGPPLLPAPAAHPIVVVQTGQEPEWHR